MISSGGSEGASDLLGGGSVGSFLDSGGCIGPAACARSEAGAPAKAIASAQHSDKVCNLSIMNFNSICWMPSAGILLTGPDDSVSRRVPVGQASACLLLVLAR